TIPMGGVPRQVILRILRVLARVVVDAADEEHRLPLLLPGDGKVEQQRPVDLQDAGGVLGALQVAAHPEGVLGDARDHGPSSITQVSLLPPPWLELTTSEPFRRAVRVSPPGSTQEDLPLTT